MKNFPWIEKKMSLIDFNNLSHAIIIEGQEGIGKNILCNYLINTLLKEKNSHNLINNNSHPDLFCINDQTLQIYFERFDKSKSKSSTKKIPIGFIREAIDFVMLKSGLSKNKILFIDDAENMTLSSQNALLKTLEEPPQDTYIILKSNQFKILTQTIYSRCQYIHINNISESELINWSNEFLQNNDVSVMPRYMTPKKVLDFEKKGLFDEFRILKNSLTKLFHPELDSFNLDANQGEEIIKIIDLNLEFIEKLNYIIDFSLSLLKNGKTNIHPVRLSDYIEYLSDFRSNLFQINSLNQKYALNHLLLKIPM